MEAKELRIGNWVQVPDGRFEQIGAMPMGRNHSEREIEVGSSEYSLSHLLPIPLTPDILEKAGFQDGYRRAGLIEMRVREFLTVMQGVFKGEFELIFVHSPIPFALPLRFKWVHELQNLYYSLIAEELTIEL